MSVNYSKLFTKLDELGISTKQLEKEANISGNIITRIRRNQYVSLETVEKLCRVLECDFNQIIEFDDNK